MFEYLVVSVNWIVNNIGSSFPSLSVLSVLSDFSMGSEGSGRGVGAASGVSYWIRVGSGDFITELVHTMAMDRSGSAVEAFISVVEITSGGSPGVSLMMKRNSLHVLGVMEGTVPNGSEIEIKLL